LSLAHHGYLAASDCSSFSLSASIKRCETSRAPLATADAVWYDLLLKYYAGCGDGDRLVARRSVPSRHAVRRQPRWPAPLSDIPYDHFTNVTAEDDHALYAYLMSRKPGSRSLRVTEDRQLIRASPPTKDIPPAVTPCRTVAPRSRTRRRRCAGFCSLRPRAVSICRLKLCEPNTARLSLTSGAQQSDDHSHKN
jgi:hypothetical protein